MIVRPAPDIDAWVDEMRRSLFDGSARYKADDLPDEAKGYRRKKRPISLGTCAGEVRT